jgi:predicted DCC family thiol-disulfide oxidoreductase YuxK
MARLERGSLTAKPFSYRDAEVIPPFPDDRPILIFDGNCVLCSRFVQFVLRHDRQRLFRLLAAQTPLGTALYEHYGLEPSDYETNLLIEQGRAYIKSESSLRVIERLGFPWSLASIARIFPAWLLDWLYQIIARNRLRWFGARSVCYTPAPSEIDRFIA